MVREAGRFIIKGWNCTRLNFREDSFTEMEDLVTKELEIERQSDTKAVQRAFSMSNKV